MASGRTTGAKEQTCGNLYAVGLTIHAAGMRSWLPMPGRGLPALRLPESRAAASTLPHTRDLPLQRKLKSKGPLLSLEPLPCT